jgi:hypothetical protein
MEAGKENRIKTINPNLDFLNAELFDEWPLKKMFHRRNIEE